ncbi:unnamed protein product [Onchocerca ochengi]|uniref:ATP-dependent DNA helicase n=1 Tax=Onchocerca ochengi TaxID=42157 RepID=A0A182ETR5_ONCOC|nr:unnamed protein product [Onchocerca ochengi]
MCCAAGKIKLPQFEEPLDLLKILLAGYTNESKRQGIQLAYPNDVVRRRNCNVMTKNTIHGTCGKMNSNLPCMIDGKYCRRYPRALISNTVARNDEYPSYRRSAEDGSKLAITQMWNGNIKVDNRIAHSALKLPLSMPLKPQMNISKASSKKKVLKNANLLFGKKKMAHKKSVEALDRSLQDLRENARPFRNALVVLERDFRQILSAIPQSTQTNEINACLKYYYLAIRKDIRINYIGCPAAKRSISWDILTSIAENWERKGGG